MITILWTFLPSNVKKIFKLTKILFSCFSISERYTDIKRRFLHVLNEIIVSRNWHISLKHIFLGKFLKNYTIIIAYKN